MKNCYNCEYAHKIIGIKNSFVCDVNIEYNINNKSLKIVNGLYTCKLFCNKLKQDWYYDKEEN